MAITVYDSFSTETTSGTSLSANVGCKTGEKVFCAFVIRSSTYTISSGWTVIANELQPQFDTGGNVYNQRLLIAEKTAESETESVTVTQSSSARLYITLISFEGCNNINFLFAVKNTSYTSYPVFSRPSGTILISSTADVLNTNGYSGWALFKDSDTEILDNTIYSLNSSTRLATTIDYNNLAVGEEALLCERGPGVASDHPQNARNYITILCELIEDNYDPTPDWANCFVKTASGNKAVEKVWIKQGSNLNVVWEPPLITYTVTNTLTHCTSNNSATSATKGTSYTATITANSGYTLDGATVSVTMGGTNITSTAYSNGVITIESVTGDIVVRVSAVKEPSQTPVNIIVDLTVKLNNGDLDPNGIMLMSALTGDQRPADNITIGIPQSKFTWENVMYMAGEYLLLYVHTGPQGRYEMSIENRPVATPVLPSGTPIPLQEYIQLVYGIVYDGQIVRVTLEQQ